MIFFPSPYPDELIHSVIARYHFWSHNRCICHTLEDLFNQKNIVIDMDFPRKLNFISITLFNATITPMQLIKENTLLPFYEPFVSKIIINQIIKIMSGDKGNLHVILYRSSRNFFKNKSLRFCLKCIKCDTKTYGEAYWHRSHQPYGVVICHKHNCTLYEIPFDGSNKKNNPLFIPLNKKMVKLSRPLIVNSSNPIFEKIARDTNWLLSNNMNNLNINKIYRKHAKILVRDIYEETNGLIELHKKFFEFYEKLFLEPLFESHKHNKCWIELLCSQSIHPFYHLLMLNFLGLELNELSLLKPYEDSFFNF